MSLTLPLLNFSATTINLGDRDTFVTKMQAKDAMLNSLQTNINAFGAQANAAIAALQASSGAFFQGVTSTTSHVISMGSKAFAVADKKGFAVGQRCRVINAVGVWVEGDITAVTTTLITVNVTAVAGSGTLALWAFALTGSAGETGATGATGATGPAASITAAAPLAVNASNPAAPVLSISAPLNLSFIPRGIGLYETNTLASLPLGTVAGAAGLIMLAPVYIGAAINIAEIGIEVTTLLASSLAKIVIYASGIDNCPAARLYMSADHNCATVGYKSAAPGVTLQSGWYYFGVHFSATQTVRGVAQGASMSLGQSTATQTTVNTCIQRTIAYASGAPAAWGATLSSEAVSAVVPLIKWR